MFEEIVGDEPHPVLSMPERAIWEKLSEKDRRELLAERRRIMVAEKADPLRNGFEPRSWARADRSVREFRERYPIGVLLILVLGGHRAAKTEWRSKRSVENLFDNSNYKIWACQATQEASRESQQIPIYKYLPVEYKAESGKLRRGKSVKVNYTPWGGFTEDVFAVVNRFGTTSECRFKFYSMNPKSLEGAEINEAWADEQAELEWLEALIFRLVSRNGLLFMTFTPRWGYTQTVKAILGGAVTLEEGEADTDLIAVLDGNGKVVAAKKVPLVQENLGVALPGHTKVKARICYFHSAENPFPLGNWANMKETLRGASEEKILTTAYGVPTKGEMSAFPRFRDLSHVVSLNRFREVEKGGGVWVHFLDPCSGRNWFQCWVFINRLNHKYVVGESPSFDHGWAYIPGVGNPGPWAVPGNKADGEMGDGQREWGWGYGRYLEEIDRMERILSGSLTNVCVSEAEAGEKHGTPAQKISVMVRWIDARYGNTPRQTEERSVTMIEDLEALGMIFLAAPSEQYIDGGRSGGTGSLRMINDLLYFDEGRPIDFTNTPKLFVVETCPNVIHALKDWTGRDGQHGALKDPIDCLRMMVLSGVEYVDESLLQPRTPWMAQFGVR